MNKTVFKIKSVFKWTFFNFIIMVFLDTSLYAACSATNSQAFTVNELNTFDNWIELYANPQNIQSPVTNWSATVCTDVGCETQSFDFDISNGSYYVVLSGYNNQWHKKSLDILIKDDAGNAVNYFNLAYTKAGGTKITTQEQDAIDCGLDLACNYFTHDNNGERNFSRDPDGGCTLDDSSHNKDTEDGSNDPTNFFNPINISVNDIAIGEGDVGTTQFVFTVQINPIVFFGFVIFQPTHTSDLFITYSTQDGSATIADNDYSPMINGVVSIPAGQTSATFSIDVIGDTNIEIDESFFINLQAVTVGSFSDNQAVGTIINDDAVAHVEGSFNAVNRVSGLCDAQNNWDDNIQTKIVNDNINLSLLAKDSVTGLPMEATISKVQLYYYPSGDNSNCTGISTSFKDVCTNCGDTDINGCLPIAVNNTLNDTASKCVQVRISGRDKNDPDMTNNTESNASDNFSTRPEKYSCDGISVSPLVAEKVYTSSVLATPLNLNTATSGYITSTVNVSSSKYMRTGDLNASLNGTINVSGINFTDGSASDVNVSFNDVGDIGIDINDSTWASVDSDDTPESNRTIYTQCRRIFRPDHFRVLLNRPDLENNASTGFTYLSNLSPGIKMSAWVRDLNVTITAKGENNATMQNYKDPQTDFYANTVTLFPLITLPVKHSSASKEVDLVDENSSDILGFSFINGVATRSYTDVGFNYDRNFNTPIPPFSVEGNESFFSLDVQDRLYPVVEGNATTSSDNNVSFYYGRLRPNDLITTLLPVNASIIYEVYDNTKSSLTQAMNQSSLFWFVNDLHDSQNEGNVTQAIASSDNLIDNSLGGFTFIYNTPSDGAENLGITVASTSKAVIHLKTQEWLWYVPSGFGSAYDDTSGSDCTMHPCFQFSLSSNNTALKVESGDFNGTVVPDVNRSDYIKKGVKLFR